MAWTSLVVMMPSNDLSHEIFASDILKAVKISLEIVANISAILTTELYRDQALALKYLLFKTDDQLRQLRYHSVAENAECSTLFPKLY